jgi:hypothetical protein
MSWISSVRNDIASIRSTEQEWKKFGLTVGGVFVAVGIAAFWKQWWTIEGRACVAGAGVLLMLFGLLAPGLLKGIHRWWMSAAIIIGSIVSRILLMLIFFCILTPVALVARCSGKRFLQGINNRSDRTYWIMREQQHKIDYERMS